MSYTVEKISGNKVKLTFVESAEAFDAAMQKAYLKNRGKINVPGFRKGKAPRKLIENMYGESVFYDDAFEIVAQPAYDEALKADAIAAVDRPEVDIQQIGAGQELKFTIEVFVKPDITLGEYKGVAVEKNVQPVTEEAINARIDSDVERASTTQDVTDRPVQAQDTVNLDYAGSVDGVPFEGGTAQGQTLVIGSNTFIPGFEDQMIGMSIGEEKDLQVKFPEQYHAEELAGKDAVFHVKVNGIQEKIKPELDDDFAADVSEFDTFAAYRQNIVDTLEKNASERAESELEDALVQKVVDAADCDIPNAMIEDEITSMLREMEMRMAYQGLRFEDYLKYTGQTMDQLREQYKSEATNRVKTQLVLEAVAKAESIEPTEEDIEATYADQAKRMNREVEEFKASLSDGQKAYLKETAGIKKTIDFLKANAVITEKVAEKAEEKPAKKPRKKKAADKAEDTAEEKGEDRNALSMVLLIKKSQFRLLLTGDISSEQEQKLDLQEIRNCTVLKCSHHGSRFASGEEFLRAVSPKVTVISCAARNSYGHPAPETVERLTQAGSRVCYTMQSGAILMQTGGKKLRLRGFFNPLKPELTL